MLQRIRESLRSSPGLRTVVRSVEDALHPRHPERDHPVVPLSEAFPRAAPLAVRRTPAVEIPMVQRLPLADEATHLGQPLYVPPVRYGVVLPNVLFCPHNNVALTNDRHVLSESLAPPYCIETLNRRPLSENRIETIGGTATALRSHYHNHYETLVDNLPRLALLHEPPFSNFDSIQVLYFGELTPMEGHLLPLLLPENALLRRVRSRKRLYRVESYVLSTFLTQCYGSYLPPAYTTWFRRRVLPNRPSRQNRRLVISREKAPTRHIVNRQALLRALAPFGFEAVHLEDYAPEEQIELFYDAEAIVAPHGAGLANLCFAKDAFVLELFPTRRVRPCYLYLSASLDLDYNFCLPRPHLAGRNVFDDFEVDIPTVLDRLRSGLLSRSHRGNGHTGWGEGVGRSGP